MDFECQVLHPTYMVKKEVYQLLGGYRELPVEDYDFLFRASEAGVAINNLSEKLLDYRISPNGLSFGNPAKSIQMTRYIQSMHKKRILGKDEAAIRDQMRNYVPSNDTWFRLVYFARSKAICKLGVFRNRNSKIGKALIRVAISIISLCHYKIFVDSYLIFRASRIVYTENRHDK